MTVSGNEIAKCEFKYQDLQMFGLKYNKYG